jgi:hypothetical protein
MLSPAGMSLAELTGMLRKSFSVLLASLSMLLLSEGMLPVSVPAMLKNSASAAFTPAEYIKPFLISAAFAHKKLLALALQRGQDRLGYVSYL